VAAQEEGGAPALRQFVVIRVGTLIDGKSDSVRHNQVIVIRGDRIDSVSDAGSAKIPAGASVIDLSHATVLPGLIDSHTHIFLQGEDPKQGGYDANILKYPLAFRAARATVSVRRALEQGFTTLRDVETEGAGYGDVGIKEAIEGGYIPGPRLFVSTLAISTTGGYPLEGYAPELTMRLPRTMITWFRFGCALVPSISVPARMTMVLASDVACVPIVPVVVGAV